MIFIIKWDFFYPKIQLWQKYHKNPIIFCHRRNQIVEKMPCLATLQKFFDPDQDADDFWNFTTSFLYTDASLVKFLRRSEKPMIHEDLSVTEPELWAIKISHCENRNFRFFASVTLTLKRWPSYRNLTRIPYTGRENMKFLRQGFRNLSSDKQTYRHDRNYMPPHFAGGRQRNSAALFNQGDHAASCWRRGTRKHHYKSVSCINSSRISILTSPHQPCATVDVLSFR